MEDAVFLLAAFVAEILGTIAGFGSSTILLPFAFLLFDLPTALALVAIYHIFGNIGRMIFFKQGLKWRLIFIFGIPSLIFAGLGAFFIAAIPQDILKFVFGMFIVVYAISAFLGKEVKLKPTDMNAVIGGGVSGFAAGLIGTGGPFRAAFLHAFKSPKNTFIATSAAVAMTADIPRLGVYIWQGYVTREQFLFIPALFVIAFAGVFIGKQVVNKISTKVFHDVVLVGLSIIGFHFIYEGSKYLIDFYFI